MSEVDTSGSKKKRSIKWVIVIAAVGMLLPFVVWFGWGIYWSGQIRGELQKIKDAGQPVSFAELASGRPSLDVEGNAGPVYGEAMGLVRGFDFYDLYFRITEELEEEPSEPDDEFSFMGESEEESSTRDDAFSFLGQSEEEPLRPAKKDVLQEAKQLIEGEAAAIFALIDKAGAMPICEYDFGESLDRTSAMNSYSDVRALVRLSKLRTYYLIYTGQHERAAETIISTLRMQRVYLRHPVLLSELVRATHLAMVADDIRFLLEQDHLDDDVLVKLIEALEVSSSYFDLKRMVMGERVVEIYQLNFAITPCVNEDFFPEQIKDHKGMVSYAHANVFRMITLRYYAARMLEEARRHIKAIDESWYQSQQNIEAIDNDRDDNKMYSWWGFKGSMLSLARGKVASDTALFAVNIERFRKREGRLPESLDELAGEFIDVYPADPYTGGSYLYRVEDGGYVIYSAGFDGVDDGGQIDRNDEGRELDFGIRMWR